MTSKRIATSPAYKSFSIVPGSEFRGQNSAGKPVAVKVEQVVLCVTGDGKSFSHGVSMIVSATVGDAFMDGIRCDPDELTRWLLEVNAEQTV